jgi:hypothetical protein
VRECCFSPDHPACDAEIPAGSDRAKAARAMLKMVKIDIAALDKAYYSN